MNEIIYTQKSARYMWTVWTSDGQPDLSPLSLSGLVLPSIRTACERAAEDIIKKSKNLPPEYMGAAEDNPLAFMFETAFDGLDSLAFKLLKKVYSEVQKNYYTVIFQDPTGKCTDYTGYTPPYAFFDLEGLVRERGAVSGEGATALARTERLKANACKYINGQYICTQPVSGQTMCAYWEEPDDDKSFQCYYQIRNETQKDMSDAFQCGNANAIAAQ